VLLDLPPIHDVRTVRSAPPRVSVLVPTFKAGATVRAAVESVVRQSYRDLEIIVIDDCCPLNSITALEGLNDDRLRIIRPSRNLGLSGARNAGISVARGEYVALLDADDISLPRRIEQQVAVLDGHKYVGMVAGLANVIDEKGVLKRPAADAWRVSDEALEAVLLFLNPLIASSYMLRRSAMPQHGFRQIYSEDYAMTHDILAGGHRIMQLRNAVVDYRISSGGIMAKKVDAVADGALNTQRAALARLGMPESQHDPLLSRTMMYVGTAPPELLSIDWLEKIRVYIGRIEAANESSRLYSLAAMAEATARLWNLMVIEAFRRGRIPLSNEAIKVLFGKSATRTWETSLRGLAHLIRAASRRTLASRTMTFSD
jgi:glycosyltransferase involved in cell wall biosynthesis